jgi:geranylgeranyl reductase family protein
MPRLSGDVLVVGAGPAGSAVAAALARAGREVVLVERAQHPRPKACAEYASPRIVEELQLLGVSDDAWQRDALPLRGMHVIRGDDRVEIAYRDRSGPRSAWGLDRLAFDAALAAHARESGAELLERTAFEDVVLEDGRVVGARVRTAQGQVVIGATWVVGADGARSLVAQRLGVTRPVRFPHRLGLVAHYEGIPALTDHGEMHVGPGWYVGLAPLAGGRLNVGMALPRGRRGGSRERYQAAIDRLPAVAARLDGVRRVTPIRGALPIGHRVSRAAGSGWMLVGDAAGFIDPFTGEGIYRALRSARAASEALLTTRLDPSASERYLAERRQAFAAKDALTWLVQGMLASGPMMGYALRRLARRRGTADLLGPALGDCRPAIDAISPRFLASVLWP